MVFLGKTREKGLKALTKEKKKPQPAAATKPAAAATPAAPQQPLRPLQADLPLRAEPIHVSLPLQIQVRSPPSSDPSPQAATTAAASPLGGSPWWVSDVTFVVEGRKIPGHKVVLQSRSDYFTKLFQASTQDVTLEVTDFSHHIFTQFIRWIYGGKKDVAPQDVRELARCAQHYESPELLSHCQRMIEEEEAAAASLAASQPPPSLQHAFAPLSTPIPSSTSLGVHLMEEPHHSHGLEHQLPPQEPFPAQPEGFAGYAEQDFPLIESQDYQLDELMFTDFSQDLGELGMTVWSNDPVLFTEDSLRTMEIY